MRRMIANLLKGQTDSTLVQLFRYTLVGGLAFVIDFAALVLLTEVFHVHYLAAAAVAFALGVATNYCISVVWVFDKRTLKNPLAEFTVFALLGLFGLGINELLIYSLTELAGLYYLLSKVVSTGVTYLWNFVSRKTLLFSFPAKAEVPYPGSVPSCAVSDVGLVE